MSVPVSLRNWVAVGAGPVVGPVGGPVGLWARGPVAGPWVCGGPWARGAGLR